MVNGATLYLTCGIDPTQLDYISIYASRLKKTWDESNVTWNERDTSVTWDLPGADDTTDRAGWEPPYYGYSNNTFQINVTSIVQDAVINSRSTINILLAATGCQYNCHMTDSSDSYCRPYLSINTKTEHTPMVVHFHRISLRMEPFDGFQLFLLSAALTQKLSWKV